MEKKKLVLDTVILDYIQVPDAMFIARILACHIIPTPYSYMIRHNSS